MIRKICFVYISVGVISALPFSCTAAQEFPPIHSPDKYAWDLFIELNHPVQAGNPGVPNTRKSLGEDGETVWESWARAQDVFRDDACKPGDWGYWLKDKPSSELVSVLPASKVDLILAIQNQFVEEGNGDEFRMLFDPEEPFSETKMNKEAYDFIVENELYSLEGQEKFHKKVVMIDLPQDAKEIKSAWRLLSEPEAESGNYHTHRMGGKSYGLIALHIITKDLPQWFWSTFEHISNPDTDIRDTDNDVRWLDRYTDAGDANKLPSQIKGTKWENYRLKGTQIDFVTLEGRDTILANTIIERGFMGTSSCVSCHARATIGDPLPELGDGASRRGNRLPIFKEIALVPLDPTDPASKRARFIQGWVGAPDPNLYFDRDIGSLLSPKRKYTQTDFMWSFFRARSELNCIDE